MNRRRVKSNVEAKTVELKSVGTIKMERSRRARHISVSVRPFKGVRVAVPLGVSFASAELFAQSKAGWIRKHLHKMEQMERAAKVVSENNPINRTSAANIWSTGSITWRRSMALNTTGCLSKTRKPGGAAAPGKIILI